MFEVKVDEVSFWVMGNSAAAAFDNIKVFASRGNSPAAAKMKNLKVQTKKVILSDLQISQIYFPQFQAH